MKNLYSTFLGICSTTTMKKSIKSVLSVSPVCLSIISVSCDGDDIVKEDPVIEGASITYLDTSNLDSKKQVQIRVSISDGSTGGSVTTNNVSAKVVETDTQTGQTYTTDLVAKQSDDCDDDVTSGGDDDCNECDNKDKDKDGYTTCGNSTKPADCNDKDKNINPGATESCDGKDNDCDKKVDEGFDADSDGYTTCSGDCDDSNSAINPKANELCDGKDNNCDGKIDENFDSDGDGYSICEGDCNDNDKKINPTATETCDSVDNNCDNVVDEGFDADSDGYTNCDDKDPLFDCDDSDATINPSAQEICDEINNDCDDYTDEVSVSDSGDVVYCGDDVPSEGDCNIVSHATFPLAIAFVIDRSGSINSDEDDYIASSVQSAISAMLPDDQFEIINFNSQIYVDQAFTNDSSLLIAALNSPAVEDGYSAAWDAMIQGISDAVLVGTKGAYGRAVIALTDGEDNRSSYTHPDVIHSAQSAELPVFTVGYDFGYTSDGKSDLNRGPLQSIASSSGGRFYENLTSLDLDDVFKTIVDSMQKQYDICYETKSNGNSSREIEVQITLGSDKKYSAKTLLSL